MATHFYYSFYQLLSANNYDFYNELLISMLLDKSVFSAAVRDFPAIHFIRTICDYARATANTSWHRHKQLRGFITSIILHELWYKDLTHFSNERCGSWLCEFIGYKMVYESVLVEHDHRYSGGRMIWPVAKTLNVLIIRFDGWYWQSWYYCRAELIGNNFMATV